jgi:hypothetical protein
MHEQMIHLVIVMKCCVLNNQFCSNVRFNYLLYNLPSFISEEMLPVV